MSAPEDGPLTRATRAYLLRQSGQEVVRTARERTAAYCAAQEGVRAADVLWLARALAPWGVVGGGVRPEQMPGMVLPGGEGAESGSDDN
jgi:hypothetical protein